MFVSRNAFQPFRDMRPSVVHSFLADIFLGLIYLEVLSSSTVPDVKARRKKRDRWRARSTGVVERKGRNVRVSCEKEMTISEEGRDSCRRNEQKFPRRETKVNTRNVKQKYVGNTWEKIPWIEGRTVRISFRRWEFCSFLFTNVGTTSGQCAKYCARKTKEWREKCILYYNQKRFYLRISEKITWWNLRWKNESLKSGKKFRSNLVKNLSFYLHSKNHYKTWERNEKLKERGRVSGYRNRELKL